MSDVREQIKKWRALNEQARKLFGKDFADEFADAYEELRGRSGPPSACPEEPSALVSANEETAE